MAPLGPEADFQEPAPQPWELLAPTPDESPVQTGPYPGPDAPPAGYDPTAWTGGHPGVGVVPGWDQGEPLPWDAPDPLPRETDPESPVVAAYEGPDRQIWDVRPAPGGVDPGMAGSETFAPEHDANPEGAAADQAWADEQAATAKLDQRADEYDRLDPVAFADMQAKRQLKADAERATLELANAETDRQALEDDIKRREAARALAQRDLAEVTTTARDMADGSPFANWWADRSVPQQVTGIFATIFAGLDNPRGPNSALEMFQGLANADADQKWKKLESRRGLAQDALGNADDDYKMRESIRLASMLQMQRAVEQQLARLDPEGSAAMKLSMVHRGVASQMAEAAQALEELRFARADKIIKADQDQQRIDIEAARENRLGRGGAGGGGGLGGAGSGLMPPAYYEALYGLPPGGGPPIAMNAKDFDKWIATKGRIGQQALEVKREANIEQGTKLEINKLTVPAPWGGDLKQTDGSTFLARTETEGVDARKKLPAAYMITSMIDQILDIRRRVGGESATFNSDEYQQLKVLREQLLKVDKASLQGMSSDEDMKVIRNSLGADSPASFRARAAGLKLARQRVVSNLNTYLSKGLGYDGKPISIPNGYKGPKAKRDPDVDAFTARNRAAEDKPALQGALEGILDPTTWGDFAGSPEIKKIDSALKGNVNKLLGREAYTIDAGFEPITAKHREALGKIVAAIEKGGADGVAAARKLRRLVGNPSVAGPQQALAADALMRLAMKGDKSVAAALDDEDEE